MIKEGERTIGERAAHLCVKPGVLLFSQTCPMMMPGYVPMPMRKQPAKERCWDRLHRSISQPMTVNPKQASRTGARRCRRSDIMLVITDEAAAQKKIGIVRACVRSAEKPNECRITGRKLLKQARLRLMQE
jgi:hypothetical protein